jgi:SAM-dependent methyltransferase
MSAVDLIMRQPLVYRLWMAPFAERKFAPIAAHNDMSRIRRVLDVGCGPGTNVAHFAASDYLGIDLNPEYVADAERRYRALGGRVRFRAQDAAAFVATLGERFDFVLVNSFLHHVDDAAARSILANLARLLAPGGHVHILELILPETSSIPRFLARADRGKFARPLEDWRRMFLEFFEPVEFEPYDLARGSVCLWKMIYFKGKAKEELP